MTKFSNFGLKLSYLKLIFLDDKKPTLNAFDKTSLNAKIHLYAERNHDYNYQIFNGKSYLLEQP